MDEIDDFYRDEGYSIELEVLERMVRKPGDATYASYVANAAMVELVKNNRLDLLLLRDDKVSKWWGNRLETVREELARERERERVKRIKAEAIAKLTDAERKALGIRKPRT